MRRMTISEATEKWEKVDRAMSMFSTFTVKYMGDPWTLHSLILAGIMTYNDAAAFLRKDRHDREKALSEAAGKLAAEARSLPPKYCLPKRRMVTLIEAECLCKGIVRGFWGKLGSQSLNSLAAQTGFTDDEWVELGPFRDIMLRFMDGGIKKETAVRLIAKEFHSPAEAAQAALEYSRNGHGSFHEVLRIPLEEMWRILDAGTTAMSRDGAAIAPKPVDVTDSLTCQAMDIAEEALGMKKKPAKSHGTKNTAHKDGSPTCMDDKGQKPKTTVKTGARTATDTRMDKDSAHNGTGRKKEPATVATAHDGEFPPTDETLAEISESITELLKMGTSVKDATMIAANHQARDELSASRDNGSLQVRKNGKGNGKKETGKVVPDPRPHDSESPHDEKPVNTTAGPGDANATVDDESPVCVARPHVTGLLDAAARARVKGINTVMTIEGMGTFPVRIEAVGMSNISGTMAVLVTPRYSKRK